MSRLAFTFVVPVYTSFTTRVLSSHVRTVKLALLFEPFMDTYLVRSLQESMPSSVNMHPVSFPYERQIKRVCISYEFLG